MVFFARDHVFGLSLLRAVHAAFDLAASDVQPGVQTVLDRRYFVAGLGNGQGHDLFVSLSEPVLRPVEGTSPRSLAALSFGLCPGILFWRGRV